MLKQYTIIVDNYRKFKTLSDEQQKEYKEQYGNDEYLRLDHLY